MQIRRGLVDVKQSSRYLALFLVGIDMVQGIFLVLGIIVVTGLVQVNC